jgi:hypothetical protein
MWLEKQLEIANHYSKPVIGILPQGEVKPWFFQRKSGFPGDLGRRANEIVARNATEIIKTVDRLSVKPSSQGLSKK